MEILAELINYLNSNRIKYNVEYEEFNSINFILSEYNSNISYEKEKIYYKGDLLKSVSDLYLVLV